MRVLVIPLIAGGVLAGGGASNVPSEQQMRSAFEIALTGYVNNARQFVAEAGGPLAVEKLRQAGTDWFAIRAFEKRDCMPSERSFLCNFVVDIDLSTGTLRRALSGRFFAAADGLRYSSAVGGRRIAADAQEFTLALSGD